MAVAAICGHRSPTNRQAIRIMILSPIPKLT
jgi:hypothetical protein